MSEVVIKYLICDVCRKKVNSIEHKYRISPDLQGNLSPVYSDREYDVCDDCNKKIKDFIETLKEDTETVEESCPNSACALH